jgi:YjbE family integral membrane protein
MTDFGPAFLFNAFRIVLIDILLAGDNAVVIAMAVKSLPPDQRRRGTIAGAGGAILLRIALTFFAVRLLGLPFFQLAGGLLILWIAVRLLTGPSGPADAVKPAGTLRQAIWMILAADVTMSLDNIVAVAGAANGSLILLIVGLALSISFVMFMSGLLSRLMDRYPVILWAGAAILGQVAGGMIAQDPVVAGALKRLPWGSGMDSYIMVRASEAALALLVLVFGFAINGNKRKKRNDARV